MCLSVCAVRPSVRAVRLALVVLSLSATSTVVSAQQVAAPSAAQDANVPVSYTHLTLPTILLV